MPNTDVRLQGRLLDEITAGTGPSLRGLSEEAAVTEKIIPQWLAAGGERPNSGLTLAGFRQTQDRLATELVDAVTALRARGVDVLLLRGFAFQRLYPAGSVRQFSDIDLAIRDVADLPAVVEVLDGLGHRVVRPITAWSSRRGVWAGVAFNKPSGHELPYYLDLVIPGPAMGWGRHHAIDDSAWHRRTHVALRGTDVPVLAPADLLTVFLVELLERETCLVRDALDFVVLTGADDFDADRAIMNAAVLPVRQGLVRLLPILRASGHQNARRLAARLAASTTAPSALDQFRSSTVRLLGKGFEAVRGRNPNLAARIAVAGSVVSAAARLGLPTFLFPDPDRRLAGLPATRTRAALDGFTARLRPIADEAEQEYAFSTKGVPSR